MAGMFDLFESGLLRGNRTGGAAFDIPGSGPAASPATSAYDEEVRKRLATMRAGGTPPASPSTATPPPAATSTVGAEAGKTAAKGFGARLMGVLNPLLTGATLMGASSSAGEGSDVVIDQTTGKPFPRGIPLNPELVKRTGIPTTGAPLTPDQIASINMTGRSGVGARVSPVTPEELALGERNYQVATQGLGANAVAPTAAPALDPRIKTDASGAIVRSGPTLDANGNVVIDTARVGQVAAEEKAIMARAFPKAGGATGGGARTVTEGGMPTFGGNFADFPRFAQELGNYAAVVGAQRSASRTAREVLKEQAKAAGEAKPFTVEGLTGKTVVQGDKAYSLDEKGNLVVKKVPATAQTFGPGLDPTMVRKEAEAAVKAGKSKAAINQALKDNGYNFQVK